MPSSKWDVNKCINSLYPQRRDLKAQRFKDKDEISRDDLIQAYKDCAAIIDQYGEDYLPIFKRLHEELIKSEEKMNLLEMASRISSESNNLNLI